MTMYQELPCLKYEDGAYASVLHPVVDEIPVSVIVNGRTAVTMMTSPTMLRELAVGFLLTEGVIRRLDEIEALAERESSVEVITKNPQKFLFSKKSVLSGCGGTTSFLDTRRLPKVVSDFVVAPETIIASVRDLLNSPLHRLTGGVHGVGLVRADGTVVTFVEDIGRHNALDRVIGYAALNEVETGDCFVVCTGRISSEMARKCLRARIPLIVSRGATTTLAVGLAEKGGLAIAGFVRAGRMNIYTHPERIVGAPAISKEE
jgi:FdhD protein